MVANNPALVRRCDDIRPGYRRIEEGSHVLLFKFDARGMLVVRVPHKRMLPGVHITDEDEKE
jgi:toxin ParE1/3/4